MIIRVKSFLLSVYTYRETTRCKKRNVASVSMQIILLYNMPVILSTNNIVVRKWYTYPDLTEVRNNHASSLWQNQMLSVSLLPQILIKCWTTLCASGCSSWIEICGLYRSCRHPIALLHEQFDLANRCFRSCTVTAFCVRWTIKRPKSAEVIACIMVLDGHD